MMRWMTAGGLAIAAATAPAWGQTALDGDTLNYQGTTVHLWGIDAPEKAQICADNWPAGRIAATYLAGLIKGRKVDCALKDTPAPKPVFAVCTVDGQDLSKSMTADGMAWAVPSQTQDYTVGEANAMIAVLGVHAHPCMKAWEWRARGQSKP